MLRLGYIPIYLSTHVINHIITVKDAFQCVKRSKSLWELKFMRLLLLLVSFCVYVCVCVCVCI